MYLHIHNSEVSSHISLTKQSLSAFPAISNNFKNTQPKPMYPRKILHMFHTILFILWFGNWLLGKLVRKWKDNIKVDITEISSEDGNSIQAAHDRPVLLTALNFHCY